MSSRDYAHQEERLDQILFSNADSLTKVQNIIKLGFDAEVADEIVERHQSGTRAPVYYERLDFADMDDDDELEASDKPGDSKPEAAANFDDDDDEQELKPAA